MGDVEMAQLHALGARAARYVNIHEAFGSVSLAIDPALIRAVSSIELPVVEAAVAETAAAAAATVSMAAAVQSDDDSSPEWTEFVEILRSEYLSGVNPQVREPFLNAVGEYDDPAGFHRRFRVVAGLLKRPDVVSPCWRRRPAGSSLRSRDGAAGPAVGADLLTQLDGVVELRRAGGSGRVSVTSARRRWSYSLRTGLSCVSSSDLAPPSS